MKKFTKLVILFSIFSVEFLDVPGGEIGGTSEKSQKIHLEFFIAVW